jgi:hypothetical protein
MNTGQMMLTIGALILLGTTVFTVNRNSLNQGTIMRQTESGIYAVSLATSYIQKALSLDFDENTVVRPNALPTNQVPSLLPLTPAAYLGREPTAGMTNKYGPTEWANKDTSFDDFDDYNNFSIDTVIVNVDRFHVTAFVYYVTQPTTAQPTPIYTATPTWLKRLDLCVNSSMSRKVFEDPSVANKQGTDTIKISYIKSFY